MDPLERTLGLTRGTPGPLELTALASTTLPRAGSPGLGGPGGCQPLDVRGQIAERGVRLTHLPGVDVKAILTQPCIFCIENH
jgi:hypothetical protein